LISSRDVWPPLLSSKAQEDSKPVSEQQMSVCFWPFLQKLSGKAQNPIHLSSMSVCFCSKSQKSLLCLLSLFQTLLKSFKTLINIEDVRPPLFEASKYPKISAPLPCLPALFWYLQKKLRNHSFHGLCLFFSVRSLKDAQITLSVICLPPFFWYLLKKLQNHDIDPDVCSPLFKASK
jgi:hypothetical protein